MCRQLIAPERAFLLVGLIFNVKVRKSLIYTLSNPKSAGKYRDEEEEKCAAISPVKEADQYGDSADHALVVVRVKA